MNEQSEYSKLPKRLLVLISKELIDSHFEFDNPYDYSYESTYNIFRNIISSFGSSFLSIDVEFFAKFIEINEEILNKIFDTKDKSLYNDIVIPFPKKYKIEYHSRGRCDFKSDYEQIWTSYDKDWVRESIDLARNDGQWYEDEGEFIDTEYDDYETYDWEIDYITESNQNLKESKLKKSTIESLDKKTLLELRGLIDDRLKTL